MYWTGMNLQADWETRGETEGSLNRENMTNKQEREWVRERQRENEQHGGIISDSVKGLGRNAEVWHTRMWTLCGLVSLFSPPLPLLFSAGTHRLPDHSLQSHHSPASHFLSPSLRLWHACITSYLTKLTHRGVQCVVQSEHNAAISFLWNIHLGWCSRANLMFSFFWLAGDHEHCIFSRWSSCAL